MWWLLGYPLMWWCALLCSAGCPLGCAGCDDGSVCTACQTGHTLAPDGQSCICKSGYFPLSFLDCASLLQWSI